MPRLLTAFSGTAWEPRRDIFFVEPNAHLMGFAVFADSLQEARPYPHIDISKAEDAVSELRVGLTRNVLILSPGLNH